MDTYRLIDGRLYRLSIYKKVTMDTTAPRLLIPAYQPTEMASQILKACIKGIECFTPEPYELWVIDNHSPEKNIQWLIDEPRVNFVVNHTEPLSRNNRSWFSSSKGNQTKNGSYANAIGLEIALRLIHKKTKYIFPMHMDTMPCRAGWLSYLVSKININVRASGVRMDRTRVPEGVLHVLGYLVDYQTFKQAKLSFLPDLPYLDVGDKVTVELKRRGYEVFAARNTFHNEIEVTELQESFYKNFHVDRTVDDDGNVIFLHLGRGIRKANGSIENGTEVGDWLSFAETLIG